MQNSLPNNFKFNTSKYVLVFLLITSFELISINVKSQSKNDTIKIASWNIQMLPSIYAPFSKLVRKKQKIRCPKIVQYLNASEFDIVILQEVFDKKREKELLAGLSTRYPYILNPIKEGFNLKLSSGIMILSRYPFELIEHIIFNVSKKSDRGAQKGCSLLQINLNNKQLMIAGTHLDSKNEKSRTLQYELTKEKIISPYIKDSIPFFLGGDFNTNMSSEGYEKMISTFGLENHHLEDERPYTFDEFNSWNPKGYKSWIDFIFYQKNDKVKIIDQYILRPKMQYEKSSIDLADHYQIILEAVIY